MGRIQPIVFGGPMHGHVVPDGRAIQVMEPRGPNPLYDPSGLTRPFSNDIETRSIESSRIGITVTVFIDGDQHRDKVMDLFEEAVNDTFIGLVTSSARWRRQNDPDELR